MSKRILFLGLLLSLNILSASGQRVPDNSCLEGITINTEYSKADAVRLSLSELTNSGVPGASIAVYNSAGWWVSSAGLADIENDVKMHPCHLQYLQSISKTYMAVAILKLVEEHQIDLDKTIDNYLPNRSSRYITGSDRITVRMLLNHTSGIPEYNDKPGYVTYLLQHPTHEFTGIDYLKYIEGDPLDFEPGSRFLYRNTNYVILALITDQITGNHAKFITETIFKPLDLTRTFYRNEPGYLDFPELVIGYWDRYSNEILENVDVLQRGNVASLIGDDGIVTTPVDAVKFLKGLLEGKILSESTLELMMEWLTDENGEIRYGLGLDYTLINDKEIAYGHSGGGIGAGSELYFFPEKDLYVFVGINLGTVTASPLHEKASMAREKLFNALLN